MGLFDEKLTSREDQDLWIRAAEVAQVTEIPEPLVIVHVREDSLSRGMDFKTEEESYYQVLDNAFARRPNLYESCPRPPSWPRHIGSGRSSIWRQGRSAEARYLLWKSLKKKFVPKVVFYLAITFAPSSNLTSVYRAMFKKS